MIQDEQNLKLISYQMHLVTDGNQCFNYLFYRLSGFSAKGIRVFYCVASRQW